MSVKSAQRLFLFAGIYGIVVVAPLLFLEKRLSETQPPAITHPEWYYGFIWVTLAWQIVYLMLSRDALRFRPMIVPAVVGKVGFALSVFMLIAQERSSAMNAVLPMIDLVLAVLFVWAFVALRNCCNTDNAADMKRPMV